MASAIDEIVHARLPKEEAAELHLRRTKSEVDAAFGALLRKGHDARDLVPRPEPAIRTLPVAGAPSAGDATVMVTLVERGELRCPPYGSLAKGLDEASSNRHAAEAGRDVPRVSSGVHDGRGSVRDPRPSRPYLLCSLAS